MWTAAELYPRICVRDPYFALREVVQTGAGEMTARVPVQRDPGQEATPIAIAEAGRHLAILGSCAASLEAAKDGQFYYLACGARGQWLGDEPMERSVEPLWATAKAEFTSRRSATARTLLLTPQGQPLFSLEVDYNVLSAAAFTRLFGEVRQDLRRAPRAPLPPGTDVTALRQNPYTRPLELTDFHRDGGSMSASLHVTSGMCNGHFAMLPVMPVAIVASGMTRVSGQLLGELLGEPGVRFMARRVNLSADNFAHAGQRVTFGAHHLGTVGDEYTFSCWAMVGEHKVAQMELSVTRVEEPTHGMTVHGV